MTKSKKIVTACFVAVTILIIIFMIIDEVQASGVTVNNNFNETVEVIETTTITNGVSDKELAEGLAMALAAGGHQFDFATYDWQGSIVGSYESGEEENAVSFGLGKHFKKMDALLHTSYTQSSGEHYVTFGGTFRF
jgi:hypothetical protein